jgi:hypothetical protein
MFLFRLCFLLISSSLLMSLVTHAQACKYYPADCPSDRQMPDSADRFGNPVIPSEVSMEIKLNGFFSDLMQTQADKKGWELYRFDESAGSGYLNADRSGPLASNFRPPHDYEISFIFIVNKDSLQAWKEWEMNFNNDMLAEFEKMKSTQDFSGVNKMQEAKKNKMESFRNAVMIRVKFQINPGDAIASSITENIHRTSQLNVPHAVLAFQVHNDKMDEQAIFDLDQFTRCSDQAFLLFGNWNTKPDSYQYYRPAYHADKMHTDLVTPKAISSDKVRAIAMHVEGSPLYISQFLQSLDTQTISGIIVQ